MDHMSVYVNTDAKMPRRMLMALHLFETTMAMRKVSHTSHQEVMAFLSDKYGPSFSAKFKPEYMLKTQAT